MNKPAKIAVPTASPSYETDGYGWAMAQAELLRRNRLTDADWENIIEEIECVGRRERSEFESHLIRILAHMIKWEAQPERRGMSWWLSVMNGRRDAERCLRANPSLKSVLQDVFSDAVRYARGQAADETDLPKALIDAVNLSYDDAMSKILDRPDGD